MGVIFEGNVLPRPFAQSHVPAPSKDSSLRDDVYWPIIFHRYESQ